MITLKYSKNSWHAWLYKNMWGTTWLPQSMCTYFWKLVVAIILVIPAWPGLLWNKGFKVYRMGICWALHVPLMYIMGIGAAKDFFQISEQPGYVKAYLLGIPTFIGFAIAFIVLILCCAGVSWLSERINEKFSKKESTSKSPAPLVVGVKAFFGKYCPKIEWRSDEES